MFRAAAARGSPHPVLVVIRFHCQGLSSFASGFIHCFQLVARGCRAHLVIRFHCQGLSSFASGLFAFSLSQSVLCRLPFADSLRILSLLSSNSIAKACFYLLPGSLVPILASSGFDGRFAAPQEGPETSLKPVRNQSETRGVSHSQTFPPIQSVFFFSLHFRSLFFFLWRARSVSIYIYIFI